MVACLPCVLYNALNSGVSSPHVDRVVARVLCEQWAVACDPCDL